MSGGNERICIVFIKYKVHQQKSGTATETKFVPTYACIYMDQVEQITKPLNWLK